MQILKLTLENWRGIGFREIEFSPDITLIEGPNEVGKSTIVEAIQTLFTELDSSNKKQVKAVKPTDQDIGSSVEIEVKVTDHHFVYRKTYNKNKQTVLQIFSPKTNQLTGREAHDWVNELLNANVDMALWNALLVDQGEKVGLANLQDSAGLARALDEAAGTSNDNNVQEDTNLYNAVQQEYEKYFTLINGRAKYTDLETAAIQAEQDYQAADAALAAVDADARAYERATLEVRRLSATLPDLEQGVKQYEEKWQAISTLKEQRLNKANALATAQKLHNAALEQCNLRQELIADIDHNQTRLKQETDKQTPLKNETTNLRSQLSKLEHEISQSKTANQDARRALELAKAEASQHERLETLAQHNERLNNLATIDQERLHYVEILAEVKVSDAVLEKFRTAHSALDVAIAKRDAAATTLTLTAHQQLTLEIDGNEHSLAPDEATSRPIGSRLTVDLPDTISILLEPSHTVAELQQELDTARTNLKNLEKSHNVTTLAEAFSANQKLNDTQAQLDRLKQKESTLLQDVSKTEIQQTIDTLQKACNDYASQSAMAKSSQQTSSVSVNNLTEANHAVATAEQALQSSASALEEFRSKEALARQGFDQADGKYRIAEQELTGLSVTLGEKQDRLTQARENNSDEALLIAAQGEQSQVDKLTAELQQLDTELEENSPAAVEALLTNAQAAFQRARSDLNSAEQNLAILTDHLERAKANGRHELADQAHARHEQMQHTLASTKSRAAAAQRLWQTINIHRNATREAYVRPLKQAIERLGQIVFGGSFAIDIDEDWSLVSRTLHGKTLPFDALSIGAKEQLGILMRLAAAQIVAKQGGVPLIIDDALGFSDPHRLQTMGAAIAAAGTTCQIIVLSCTPGRFTHIGSAKVIKFEAD